MKILAVDNEPAVVDILSRSLTPLGHDVLTASNGREAIQVLEREGDTQVVLTDWVMPEMDGIALCRWIREHAQTHYTYVILLTGEAGDRRVVQALEAGADEFIRKPFDLQELNMRMRTAERILSLETRHLVLFALARLAESRDPETGSHLERMREVARLIALELRNHPELRADMTPAFVETVYETTPLHDIGKVGIPDYILLKPGRLSDAEFEVMKTHTTIGSETLNATVEKYPGADYLRIARDIVLTHHERYDGSGYPNGLRGDEIPLCGRIAAIADVYDALTSKRVYKDVVSHDLARSILESGRNKHFDPRMVDAFLAREEEISATHQRFAEAPSPQGPASEP